MKPTIQTKINKLHDAIVDLAAHNYPEFERAAWVAFSELTEVLNAEGEENMDNIETINVKFLKGDGISDDELNALLDWYVPVEDALRKLGPHFHFAWSEIRQRVETLRDFKEGRERDRIFNQY